MPASSPTAARGLHRDRAVVALDSTSYELFEYLNIVSRRESISTAGIQRNKLSLPELDGMTASQVFSQGPHTLDLCKVIFLTVLVHPPSTLSAGDSPPFIADADAG